MGVPGFVTWLEATAPEALVTIPYGAPPRVADVVAFDMNSLLHTALRRAEANRTTKAGGQRDPSVARENHLPPNFTVPDPAEACS